MAADTVEKLANIIIDECKRLEPCHSEVCAEEVSDMKSVFENTDFGVASSSQGTMLGLRTICNNRMGFVTTNSLDEKELRAIAREAQMVARLSPENPNHGIAPALKTPAKPLSMIDEKLKNAAAKDLLKWTDVLVTEAKRDSRVCIDRAEVNLQTVTHVIVNSNGLSERLDQTTCHWYVMGMARDGSEVTSFDYDGGVTSTAGDIESKIKATAKEFSESVLGSLGSTHAKSYKGAVLLHPAAVASLMASLVSYNVNARAQQDGMSKWAGQQGKTVASPIFNFSEDPLDTTRPGDWTPFDREGIPTQRHDIIKNGVLNFTAHNIFTATKAKTQSTGNARGGARSLPAIGLSALTVGGGKSTDAELYSALDRGLVVKRFSGNSDPVSGQFSGVAKNSWWVEGGKRTSAVKEVMISGNAFELLKNIKLVGSKIYRHGGSFDCPYILVDGVSVTAG